jgi:hypothetical protein
MGGRLVRWLFVTETAPCGRGSLARPPEVGCGLKPGPTRRVFIAIGAAIGASKHEWRRGTHDAAGLSGWGEKLGTE